MNVMKCPHGCTPRVNYAFHDCVNEPGAQPEEGDVGICYTCGGWWQLRNGDFVKYAPTAEEVAMVMPEMSASRERFEKWKSQERER